MPSGKTVSLPLAKAEPGIWRADAKAGELGLYRATDGTLSTVTAAGPLNPKEVADMRATDAVLKPDAEASGGSVHWLEDGLPEIRRVGAGDTASGDALDRPAQQWRLSRHGSGTAKAAAAMGRRCC